MQIVYVAHLSALLADGDVGGRASAEVLQGFDDATQELADEARAHLQATHLRGAAQHWHFQRRDGAIADQLGEGCHSGSSVGAAQGGEALDASPCSAPKALVNPSRSATVTVSAEWPTSAKR